MLGCSDGQGYTVAKMNLLSTSFKRVDGMYVWIGHNVLTTKVIENSAFLPRAAAVLY